MSRDFEIGDVLTLANNSTLRLAAGLHQWRGEVAIANSISWNDGTEVDSNQGSLTVSYSVIRGGWPGPGNLNLDPKFIDASGAGSASLNSRVARRSRGLRVER